MATPPAGRRPVALGRMRAVIGAAFNVVWREGTLEEVDTINVGVAITLDDGLVGTPILHADSRDLVGVSAALVDLIARTRTGRLRIDEPVEGT